MVITYTYKDVKTLISRTINSSDAENIKIKSYRKDVHDDTPCISVTIQPGLYEITEFEDTVTC
jgi:hypothetical protein